MSGRIRVALVDDQSLFRAGIRMLVSSQPDLEFVGEAGDGAAAVAAAPGWQADVVLMDVRMPVLDGITATARILEQAEQAGALRPRVVVLTTFELDEAVGRALAAGASGFLLKDAEPEFLLAAIRTVHAGSAVVAASDTLQLLQRFSPPPAAPEPARHSEFETLTVREREIFALASRGMSNAEIAATEFLSEATVKTHISRILSKLSLRDRVQLVVFAFEHGLAG
jgi:DNA-binding NarL/FixJ family response regulator